MSPAVPLSPADDAIFADDYDPNALSIDDAARRLLAAMPLPTEVEWVGLRQALGRVLARPQSAPVAVPAHRSSAMDGYALRSSDLTSSDRINADPTSVHPSAVDPAAGNPVPLTTADGSHWRLPLAGTSAAGHPLAQALPAGTAIRIMTGAVVPDGADVVVMQEHVVVQDGALHIPVTLPIRPGMNVRAVGEDLAAGALALPAGRRIRPADLGLAASLGLAELPVHPRLRVAFFSTGDELCSIGQQPAVGQVFDSNRYTLFGMLEQLGVEVHDLGVVRDTPADLQRAFLAAMACADMVISSGGVSVGDADFVRQMLERLGRTVFWKIAVKPGRPFAYGELGDGVHFFGLPGNPVAVMVTFHQLVRPALLRRMGITQAAPKLTVQAVTTAPLKKVPGRVEFQRGVLSPLADGSWQVDPTGEQGSGMLSSMSLANCFIRLPESAGKLPAGVTVTVEPFDEGL